MSQPRIPRSVIRYAFLYSSRTFRVSSGVGLWEDRSAACHTHPNWHRSRTQWAVTTCDVSIGTKAVAPLSFAIFSSSISMHGPAILSFRWPRRFIKRAFRNATGEVELSSDGP